jgi:hypothetical protein
MQKQTRHAIYLSALMVGITCFGCNTSDSPPLGQVSGRVTLDGKPLEKGRLYFIPKSGGRTSTAELDASGNYTLLYSLDEWGAKVDDHTVKISTEGEFGGGERVPAKYNVESELMVKVKPGNNVHDFELTGAITKQSKKSR